MTDAIEALIKAGGMGDRLGIGPKAFVRLGGQTLLERAVRTMLAVATKVLVAVPAGSVEHVARDLQEDRVEVIAGGNTRSDTYRRLVEASRAPWLIDHDVVHPFVSVALTRQVVELARRCGAACAARWNAETLYDRTVNVQASPDTLVAAVKPFCLRRIDAQRSIAAIDQLPPERRTDPGSIELLRLIGQEVCFVPAPPWNIKLTFPDDLRFAEALLHSGLIEPDPDRG